jgi:hypothetical protein
MSSSDEMEPGYAHHENGKSNMLHEEILHDHDVAGKATREDARHHAALTEEEKVVEKKLKRKIDTLIMPLVITV